MVKPIEAMIQKERRRNRARSDPPPLRLIPVGAEAIEDRQPRQHQDDEQRPLHKRIRYQMATAAHAKGCLSNRAAGFLRDGRPRVLVPREPASLFSNRRARAAVQDPASALPGAHLCSSAAVSPVRKSRRPPRLRLRLLKARRPAQVLKAAPERPTKGGVLPNSGQSGADAFARPVPGTAHLSARTAGSE